MHDAAANVATTAITKYYHGVYWGSSHIDMGWNVVATATPAAAIQFHDTGGVNEFDLHVHDNLIHGTVCDGLNFATVDPSQGTVEAYNNVIYDVGRGPDPSDGASDYAGIYVAGETDAGPAGSGTVQIYSNTLYDCGAWSSSSDSGGVNNGGGNTALKMNLVDNLFVATSSGEAYVAQDSASGLVTGNDNLFFGGGSAPSFLTASVTGGSEAHERGERGLPPARGQRGHRQGRHDPGQHRFRRKRAPPERIRATSGLTSTPRDARARRRDVTAASAGRRA